MREHRPSFHTNYLCIDFLLKKEILNKRETLRVLLQFSYTLGLTLTLITACNVSISVRVWLNFRRTTLRFLVSIVILLYNINQAVAYCTALFRSAIIFFASTSHRFSIVSFDQTVWHLLVSIHIMFQRWDWLVFFGNRTELKRVKTYKKLRNALKEITIVGIGLKVANWIDSISVMLILWQQCIGMVFRIWKISIFSFIFDHNTEKLIINIWNYQNKNVNDLDQLGKFKID